MKAVKFMRSGRAAIQDMPDPESDPGEILLKVVFDTQKRTIKKSGHWFADVIKNNGILE